VWIGALSGAPHNKGMTANLLTQLVEDFNQKRRPVDELMVVNSADLTPTSWPGISKRSAMLRKPSPMHGTGWSERDRELPNMAKVAD
jgi:hypothetical protein